MSLSEKEEKLLRIVAEMTENEWYRAAHAINRMFEQKNASITSNVKLEDIEAMKRDFERFTP